MILCFFFKNVILNCDLYLNSCEFCYYIGGFDNNNYRG